MSEQLKRSIIRAAWTILFSGTSSLLVLLSTIPQESLLSVSWKALLSAFLSGLIMGAKKYADWKDAPPL